MYSIGQFSLICRLSIRTLRKYHELGLLLPDHIDEATGYRYYGDDAVERARVIRMLRDLDFSLNDIKAIVDDCSDDGDLLEGLLRRKQALDQQLSLIKRMRGGVEAAINNVKRWTADDGRTESHQVVVKDVPAVLFVGCRGHGSWNDIGPLFGQAARRAGRRIDGPAMSLCYDEEYREDDAHYEAGFPVSSPVSGDGFTCRELSGGPCVTLVHRGPYPTLDISYRRLMAWLNDNDREWTGPSRELYLRGPGMILRGDPAKYVTEIQLPLRETASSPKPT